MGYHHYLFAIILVESLSKFGSAVQNVHGCGVSSNPVDISSRKKRVVGGTQTTTRSFPWTVLIKKFGHSDVVCGGAILSHRLILTAAHCFDNLNKNDMYLLVGADTVDGWNFHHPMYHAHSVIIHEHYNSSSKKNDIAMVQTTSRITFSDDVGAVCFPEASYQLPPGTEFLFAGYGDTRGTGRDRILNYIRVPLVDDALCAQSDWLGKDFDEVRDVSLCAGYADGGPDTCSGDSGGALVHEQHSNEYFVYGISSWGKGCGERHKPGVYTRVVSFIDWAMAQADHLNDD